MSILPNIARTGDSSTPEPPAVVLRPPWAHPRPSDSSWAAPEEDSGLLPGDVWDGGWVSRDPTPAGRLSRIDLRWVYGADDPDELAKLGAPAEDIADAEYHARRRAAA